MDKKAFFEAVRKEANSALSKIFDKVEEVSKVSGLKVRISNLKGEIRDSQAEIGIFVTNNQERFTDIPEIQDYLNEIKSIEEEIKIKEQEIAELKEKEETE